MAARDLIDAFSLERFGRYLDWASGEEARALELYALNTRLSEALYTPLQVLEIALRNRVHVVLRDAYEERWFDRPEMLLVPVQREQLEHAYADLARARKDATPGRVVAALTFSFWTSMMNAAYDDLWRRSLHRIARSEEGRNLRRKDFTSRLTPIRTLRNRIAHHEPILDWNLPKHHTNILQLTGWLSPAAVAWCRSLDRFENVHPSGRIQLARGDSSGT